MKQERIFQNLKQLNMETHYTPELEEFHPGFVYEMIPPIGFTFLDFNDLEKHIETVWSNQYIEGIYNVKPVTVFGSELANITSAIAENKCRVKYLDREDIESLGFKCMGGNWYHDHKAYQIIGDWKSIEISKGEHEYRDVLFKGTIKNKSELKRILKMLSIL